MKNERKLQIGIMGSAADLGYTKKTAKAAERIGELLAQKGVTVIFGAEKDGDSLSTAACRGARRAGGLTVGITYGKDKNIYENADIVIPTGLERGGGREFSVALACDSIIVVGGGSGTLSEIATAYQTVTNETPNGIPIIALGESGGWADLLAGKTLDERNRQIIQKANSPEEAVQLAIEKAKENKNRRNSPKEIALFATRAVDTVIKDTSVIKTQEGGPALFIEDVFSKENIPYELTTGEKMQVQILLTKDGEFGKIAKPKIRRSVFTDDTKWVVVSGLLDEWDLSKISRSSKVFVDIQGFVRDGSSFGKKKMWNEIQNNSNAIFCLKGTREEVGYLPKEVIEDQKKRMLVITNGAKGVEIFYEGNNFYVPTKSIINAPDTIGAGDTFFAYLISSLFKGNNPQQSAEFAVQKTGEFLEEKRG